MSQKIAFVDVETTGLDVRRHRVWEIGIVLCASHLDTNPTRYHYFVDDVQLTTAEATALRLNNFYQRHPRYIRLADTPVSTRVLPASQIAAILGPLLSGVTLAGNVVDFDARMLDALMRAFDVIPAWHYHLLDVEAYAAGVCGGLAPPWKSTSLSEELGVELPEESHTALGDAEWAWRLWVAASERASHLAALAMQIGNTPVAGHRPAPPEWENPETVEEGEK